MGPVPILKCELYMLDKNEFQSHKVVLHIIKSMISLITDCIKKARLITQGKVLYILGRYFSLLKEKAETLESSLGLHANSTT